MHFSQLLLAVSAACTVSAFSSPQDLHKHRFNKARRSAPEGPVLHSRSNEEHAYLNKKTAAYAVNGSGIPLVDFDIGESYAGTLPITANASDTSRLFFWFFPTANPAGKKEITIWLQGGPGCSSLSGLLQENGPFLWQSGTYRPVPNQYSWSNLTNMIYVDQPVGVGYSPGLANVNNETDVSTQFMGFWKNFIELFSIQGYEVYIAGESYAGKYVPYIAGAMLDAKDKNYFNVKGITVMDPFIGSFVAEVQAPAVPFLLAHNNIFNLNKTFVDRMVSLADSCGLTAYHDTYTTTFPPPPGPQIAPVLPEVGCDLWDDIMLAAFYVNPCFNIYHITDFCPYLNDQMSFPSLGVGPNNYFNRSDVKIALHVSVDRDYQICDIPNGDVGLFPNGDASPDSIEGPLPGVIERTNNVIIAHGLLDFILLANGTLMNIQNMTWNGLRGFQTAPSAENNFFVPYHAGGYEAYEVWNNWVPGATWTNDAGAGIFGKTHEERGLTFVTVEQAGHEIPQYAPGAAYRIMEKLLGRITSLEQIGDFTTQSGNYTGTSALFKK